MVYQKNTTEKLTNLINIIYRLTKHYIKKKKGLFAKKMKKQSFINSKSKKQSFTTNTILHYICYTMFEIEK